MKQNERIIIAAVLSLIAILVIYDLLNDSREGVMGWHVFIEGSLGALALSGVFFVLRGSVELRRKLHQSEEKLAASQREAESWRSESKKYVDGLAQSIDLQLTKWGLSAAEKDVAFLLLKGFSLKEVAELRGTTEKTARVQSTAVYAKANLEGRSQLAAFFLEDLLPPRNG